LEKGDNETKSYITNNEHQNFRLFLDENVLETFFRRPDFSPDGSIFIVPCGQYQKSNDDEPIMASLAFKRGNFSSPCICLPVTQKPAILVRFNPNLYK